MPPLCFNGRVYENCTTVFDTDCGGLMARARSSPHVKLKNMLKSGVNPAILLLTGINQDNRGVMNMTIAQIMQKMIRFSEGNIHDIDHFIRVWTYAKTIGELEQLDEETQYILEVAAITHDIACPLCRDKYGNTNGKHQEEEGAPLVKEFLSDSEMTEVQIDRVDFLVGHHHTFTGIDCLDWQILIEADYIANATENGYSETNVRNFIQKIMKTDSGKSLAKDVFAGILKAQFHEMIRGRHETDIE